MTNLNINIGDVICQKYIGRCRTIKRYNHLLLTVCRIDAASNSNNNNVKGVSYYDNTILFSLGLGIVGNKRTPFELAVYKTDKEIKRYFKTKYLLIEKKYGRVK